MNEFRPMVPHKREVEEEAHEVNKKVDEYFENSRANALKPKDELAHEIIKEMPNREIRPAILSREDREWLRGLRQSGVRILTDGFLQITRWDKAEGKDAKIKQKVDGINSAIRMQDYILEIYGLQPSKVPGEVEQLESIQEIIERANSLFNKWKIAGTKDKTTLQQELATVVLELEKCRNEFKVAAKEQTEKSITLKDRLKRENPSALAARTVAALNSLDKRFGEMQIIKPRIALRKEKLVFEKRRSEFHIKQVIAKVSEVLHHKVFNETSKLPAEQRIKDYEMEFLDLAIGKALSHLDSIFVAPYKQQAEQAKLILLQKVKVFLRFKKSLLSGRQNVKDGLQEALSILKSDMGEFG